MLRLLSFSITIIIVTIVSSATIQNCDSPQIPIFASFEKESGSNSFGVELVGAVNTLTFTCNGEYPLEWVIKCPRTSDRYIKITKRRDTKVITGESSFSSKIELTFETYGIVEEQMSWSNLACRYLHNHSSVVSLIRKTCDPGEFCFEKHYCQNLDSRCPSSRIDQIMIDEAVIKNCSNIRLLIDAKNSKYKCVGPNNVKPFSFIYDKLDYGESVINSRTIILDDKCTEFKDDLTHAKSMSSPSPGIVGCTIFNGFELSIAKRFYVAPSSSKIEHVQSVYWNREDATNSQYSITIIPVKDLWNGDTVIFTCMASLSLFSDGFLWGIDRLNATRVLEYPERTIQNTTYSRYVSTKSVVLDKSMISISCHGPLENSWEWKNVTYYLDILDSLSPNIIWETKNNGSHILLHCSSIGAPRPVITWKLENMSIENKSDEVRWTVYQTTNVRKGNVYEASSLMAISKGHIGKNPTRIECKATNFKNSTQHIFRLEGRSANGIQPLILTITSMLLIGVLLVTVAIVKQIVKTKKNILSRKDVEEFYNGLPKASRNADLCDMDTIGLHEGYDSSFEISKDKIQIDVSTVLGKGEFGIVYKGSLPGLGREFVAVKLAISKCQSTTFKVLLGEVKIMTLVGHHGNIVSIVGAYTKEIRRGILYIVTEFCEHGSLDKFLANSKARLVEQTDGLEIGSAICSKWSYEIASGMEFLSDKNIIHADLATRNVLLTGESFTAKVADFGLSRKVYQYCETYIKTTAEPLPWKWLAPEVLKKMSFSIKSDVWSFGITLWEIYSLGCVPYAGLRWTPSFVDELLSGTKLTKPELATDQIYRIMLKCWDIEPMDRPNFKKLKEIFAEQNRKILGVSDQYIELKML